jgi:DNA-binding Xre family transcriptional regulator
MPKNEQLDLYNSPDVAIKIKITCKERNVVVKDMLVALNMGSNTLSHMRHGKAVSFDKLARIADYLDCSVDYLLGRTDRPEVNRGDASS